MQQPGRTLHRLFAKAYTTQLFLFGKMTCPGGLRNLYVHVDFQVPSLKGLKPPTWG